MMMTEVCSLSRRMMKEQLAASLGKGQVAEFV
jgi:hypothetical protein